MKEAEKTIRILGTEVDRVTKTEALGIFEGLMQEDGVSLIVTPNPEIILSAEKDEGLRDLINSAALRIPDGIGIVYASKILGKPLSERVTGIDFTYSALEWCAANGRPVYFLGSKPGIAELAAEKLREKIPGLVVSGTRDGYFKPEEEDEVAAAIAESGAQFLCVAMGAPKQELFVKAHAGKLGNIRAAIGVGGSFDVWSGTLKRAPQFYMDHGIEWLYRFIQEPVRFKKTGKLIRFLFKAAVCRR